MLHKSKMELSVLIPKFVEGLARKALEVFMEIATVIVAYGLHEFGYGEGGIFA